MTVGEFVRFSEIPLGNVTIGSEKNSIVEFHPDDWKLPALDRRIQLKPEIRNKTIVAAKLWIKEVC